MADKVTLQYGGYVHAYGTAAYSKTSQLLLSDDRISQLEEVRISISGRIHGNDFDQCATNYGNLYDAYMNQSGVDFMVLKNNGATAFTLSSARALGGIKVIKPPDIPTTVGSIHLGYIPYSIEIGAVVPINIHILASPLKSFRETISWSGGGPTERCIETLVGRPVRQRTREYTIYRAKQQGQAVALFGHVRIPDPLWPKALVRSGDSERGNGDHISDLTGVLNINKPASWSYEFESEVPLLGLPNDWGTIL